MTLHLQVVPLVRLGSDAILIAKEHLVQGIVEESGQYYPITDITSKLGGNYYCHALNEIGSQNSTFLSIDVTGNWTFERHIS